MLDSIYIGMSGMTAYSKGLQTISNNVANLNTVGFKTSSTRFLDLYYSQPFSGGGAQQSGYSSQLGSGVQYGYAALNLKQGELRSSNGTLDLAIQGNGFLTMLDGDTARYVRTGQFQLDDSDIVTDKVTGMRLAALTGEGSLGVFSLAGKRINAPVATTTVMFTDNLSSGSTNFLISNIDVYDANGGKHTLKAEFSPDSSIMPGRWNVKVTDENGLAVQEATLQFNGGIPEPGRDKFDVTLAPAGVAPLTVSFDFSSGVTSFSAGSTSTLRIGKQDGQAMGTLTSMGVNGDGKLIVAYSNGQTLDSGTVALANFVDPQRLLQNGNGIFDAPLSSPPYYAASKSRGMGELVSGALEASNVDLSSEFGQLILVQRGFQASSQVMSTANEMIMQLFQMRGQS